MALTSIASALLHLRLIEDEDSDDLEYLDEYDSVVEKLAQASAIVSKHVKDVDESLDWDADTTPADVQAAVLLVLSDLWEHRAGSGSSNVVLSQTVRDLLVGYRDPTMA